MGHWKGLGAVLRQHDDLVLEFSRRKELRNAQSYDAPNAGGFPWSLLNTSRPSPNLPFPRSQLSDHRNDPTQLSPSELRRARCPGGAGRLSVCPDGKGCG